LSVLWQCILETMKKNYLSTLIIIVVFGIVAYLTIPSLNKAEMAIVPRSRSERRGA